MKYQPKYGIPPIKVNAGHHRSSCSQSPDSQLSSSWAQASCSSFSSGISPCTGGREIDAQRNIAMCDLDASLTSSCTCAHPSAGRVVAALPPFQHDSHDGAGNELLGRINGCWSSCELQNTGSNFPYRLHQEKSCRAAAPQHMAQVTCSGWWHPPPVVLTPLQDISLLLRGCPSQLHTVFMQKATEVANNSRHLGHHQTLQDAMLEQQQLELARQGFSKVHSDLMPAILKDKHRQRYSQLSFASLPELVSAVMPHWSAEDTKYAALQIMCHVNVVTSFTLDTPLAGQGSVKSATVDGECAFDLHMRQHTSSARSPQQQQQQQMVPGQHLAADPESTELMYAELASSILAAASTEVSVEQLQIPAEVLSMLVDFAAELSTSSHLQDQLRSAFAAAVPAGLDSSMVSHHHSVFSGAALTDEGNGSKRDTASSTAAAGVEWCTQVQQATSELKSVCCQVVTSGDCLMTHPALPIGTAVKVMCKLLVGPTGLSDIRHLGWISCLVRQQHITNCLSLAAVAAPEGVVRKASAELLEGSLATSSAAVAASQQPAAVLMQKAAPAQPFPLPSPERAEAGCVTWFELLHILQQLACNVTGPYSTAEADCGTVAQHCLAQTHCASSSGVVGHCSSGPRDCCYGDLSELSSRRRARANYRSSSASTETRLQPGSPQHVAQCDISMSQLCQRPEQMQPADNDHSCSFLLHTSTAAEQDGRSSCSYEQGQVAWVHRFPTLACTPGSRVTAVPPCNGIQAYRAGHRVLLRFSSLPGDTWPAGSDTQVCCNHQHQRLSASVQGAAGQSLPAQTHCMLGRQHSWHCQVPRHTSRCSYSHSSSASMEGGWAGRETCRLWTAGSIPCHPGRRRRLGLSSRPAEGMSCCLSSPFAAKCGAVLLCHSGSCQSSIGTSHKHLCGQGHEQAADLMQQLPHSRPQQWQEQAQQAGLHAQLQGCGVLQEACRAQKLLGDEQPWEGAVSPVAGGGSKFSGFWDKHKCRKTVEILRISCCSISSSNDMEFNAQMYLDV